MPNVQHSALTGSELHEPKGVAAATIGQIYVADGAASGDWVVPAHYSGSTGFDSATPSYAFSATTSDTVLNPTVTNIDTGLFTSTSSPNFRITYNGTRAFHAYIWCGFSLSQSSGANRDIQLVLAKNGTVDDNSRIIRTTTTANWGSATLVYTDVIAASDYFEIFGKASTSVTVNFANIHVAILGVTQ